MITIILSGLVGLMGLYVYYTSSNHRLFKKLGYGGPSPWPVIGTMNHEMGGKGLFDNIKDLYFRYKKEKVFGVYRVNYPSLYICNLDMIREICVKQFNNFSDRFTFGLEDPLGSSMTELKGDHWKTVRSTVSPSFSTARLRRMFPHIDKNVKKLVEHLNAKCESGEPVELRDLFSCFTMDTIASTGFGMDVNSLDGEDSIFTKHGNVLLGSNGRLIFIAFFCNFVRPFLRWFGIELIPKDTSDFFRKFIDQAVESRKNETNNKSARSDFIQLMLEAETEESGGDDSKKVLSYRDIQGQALIFLLAGYDTVATAMSFTLYLLAMNPECLKKAQKEVDNVLGDKSPDYDSAGSLHYLEMCINESMRVYPPGFVIDRTVENDCEIDGVKIPKGIAVNFPVCGIHHDPEYWDEPEKFDPERFTPENKANRHPYAYMPFGMGPRNCIGMRLALLEMKVALAAVLQKLNPVECSKTTPIQIDPLQLKAKDGLWVQMESRK